MVCKRRMNRTREQEPLTWDKLKEMALGVVGMNLEEFYEYSAYDLDLKLIGYASKMHEEWEKTRLLAYVSAAPHLKRKMSPENFMPLSGDKKKKKGKKKTIEEQKKLDETVKEMLARAANSNWTKIE